MIKKGTYRVQITAGWTGACIVLLMATFLRFMRIEDQSLWYDEGNTARMTLRQVGDIVKATADDIHPPGYYLAVTGWSHLAGRSEFSLRGFSALVGVILVAVVYKIGDLKWGSMTATVAGAIVAVHPALVYFSQEARMYMVASMLGAVLVALTPSMFRHYAGTGTSKRWYVYVLVGAAGLYTHYIFSFVLVAMNLWVTWQILIGSKFRVLTGALRWYVVQLGVVILYLPWLHTAIGHITTWPGERVQTALVNRAGDMWSWLAVGPTLGSEDGAVAGAVLIGTLVVYGVIRGGGSLIAVWTIITAGISLSFGLLGESFSKFLVLSVPGVALLTARGAVSVIRGRENVASMAAIAIGVPVFWFYARGLINLYTDAQYFRDDYRAIARDLIETRKSGDAILLNAPNQIEVFLYYYPETAHVFPVARSRPVMIDMQREELEAIAADHDRLSVIYWGEKQSDPDQVVERWLNENTYKTGSEWYGDVRVARYSAPALLTIPLESVAEGYNGGIELREYGIQRIDYRAGDVIQVVLIWMSNMNIQEDFTVFVHVYAEMDAPPVAQHDGYPGGGDYPTGRWDSGTKVLDRHGLQLPSTIVPGEYSVAVGLYRASDGVRLNLSSNHEYHDRLVLGTISVVE